MANSFPSPQEAPVFSVKSSTDSTTLGEQFLRLQLRSDVPILLSVRQITEILSIADSQIMPIPHMPPWMMGIYNWRGEILWIVDLAHLCGLAPWYEYPHAHSSHATVILNLPATTEQSPSAKGCSLGLVVQKVEDMEWCTLDAVQLSPPPSIPDPIAQFSVGYWQKSEATRLAILDGKTLLSAVAQFESDD